MHPSDPDGDRTRLNPLRAAAAPEYGAGEGTDSDVVPPASGDLPWSAPADPDAAPTVRHNPDAETTALIDRDAEPTALIDRDAEPTALTDRDSEPTALTDRADPDGEDWELDRRHRDWAWVEQWREEGERPAWAPGITLAVFVAGLVAVAIIVLTNGLSDTAWLALVINLVIAAGMAPALWLSRDLPVFRFLAGGAAVGLLLGWAWVLLTPAPGDMAQPAPVVAVVDSIPANPSNPG